MFLVVLAIDQKLFCLVNRGLGCTQLDVVMLFLSDRGFWVPALFVLFAFFAWRGGVRWRLAVLAALVAVAITDPLVTKLLKPLFGRLRPCWELSVRLVGGCGGRFSFPSNHAANSAAIAAALGTFAPKTLWASVPLALTVGLSRVYLGVHYPGDVVGGFLLGASFGIGVAVAIRRIFRKKRGRRDEGRFGQDHNAARGV